jgi:hypothetical protein
MCVQELGSARTVIVCEEFVAHVCHSDTFRNESHVLLVERNVASFFLRKHFGFRGTGMSRCSISLHVHHLQLYQSTSDGTFLLYVFVMEKWWWFKIMVSKSMTQSLDQK